MGNLPSRERQIGFHGRRERGFALYLIFLILGAAALITITSSISPTSVNSRDQAVRAAILSEARQALVGWAITRGSTSSPGTDRPGDLPAPDTASEATPNYDGDRDTGCMDATKTTGLPLISNSVNVRCLGRLPWRDLKLALQPPAERDQNNNAKVGEQDVEGKMPWYAVSANLTRIDNCLSMLNPETVNLPYAGFNCGSSSNIPYPWLTVRDSNGNIISDRVAFVVILPGPVIGSQQRNAAPNLGGASQYLDGLTVSSGCSAPCVPGNYSNSDLDNDFIAGDESGSFNDRLVYMTIDDLMAAVENQVASNIAAALKTAATETYTEDPKTTSNAGTPRYFWLAPFNPAGTAYQPAAISTYRGILPGHAIGDSVSTGFQWSMSAGRPFQYPAARSPPAKYETIPFRPEAGVALGTLLYQSLRKIWSEPSTAPEHSGTPKAGLQCGSSHSAIREAQRPRRSAPTPWPAISLLFPRPRAAQLHARSGDPH